MAHLLAAVIQLWHCIGRQTARQYEMLVRGAMKI